MVQSKRLIRENLDRQKYKEGVGLVVGRQLYTKIHKLGDDDETGLNSYGYGDRRRSRRIERGDKIEQGLVRRVDARYSGHYRAEEIVDSVLKSLEKTFGKRFQSRSSQILLSRSGPVVC